jgi:hypothetical protein
MIVTAISALLAAAITVAVRIVIENLTFEQRRVRRFEQPMQPGSARRKMPWPALASQPGQGFDQAARPSMLDWSC